MILELAIVEKIAHLARLGITPAEAADHAEKLGHILAWVDQMNQVDTQSVEPLAHPLEMTQRLRPDQVTEIDQRDLFQSVAPLCEAGLYLVPRVIE
ncbi:Aspartyl/glutamyl-tRNA(Asn/Gln) amidotransferase subunit C [Gammaproteobacteria bacterium]